MSNYIQDRLAAGFSMDEIKSHIQSKSQQYKEAGFSHEQIVEHMQKKYGVRIGYDENLEDDIPTIMEWMDSPNAEEVEKLTVANDVEDFKNYDKETAENNKVLSDIQKEIDSSPNKDGSEIIPKYVNRLGQMRKMEELGILGKGAKRLAEENILPNASAALALFNHFKRNYSDEELADIDLYKNRDSVLFPLEKPLTDFDREVQDQLMLEQWAKQSQGTDMPPGDMYVQGDPKRQTLDDIARLQGSSLTPNLVDSFGDSVMAGYQSSTTGLIARGGLPNVVMSSEATLGQKVGFAAGQILGDTPFYIAGSVLGGAVGKELGPFARQAVTMGSGAAFNEMTRTALMIQYERGNATNWQEAVKNYSDVVGTGTKSFITGAAGGYLGGRFGMLQSNAMLRAGMSPAAALATQRVSTPFAEMLTMTTVGAGLEGRAPTSEDFLNAGIMLGTSKMAGRYAGKLRHVYAKTGLTPKSIIEYAKQDRSVIDDLSGINIRTPRAFGGDSTPMYLITNSPTVGSGRASSSWMYRSKNTAEKIIGHLNSKDVSANKPSRNRAVEGYSLDPEANLLHIRANNDPNKLRLYRQYLTDIGFDYTKVPVEQQWKMANAAFKSPGESFIDFLQSGKGRIGRHENIPLEDVHGMTTGDKVLVFNRNMLKKGTSLDAPEGMLDITARKVMDSISYGEADPLLVKTKDVLADIYRRIVDQFQPLNMDAPIGKVTMPYAAARMHKGVDSYALKFITDQQTAFSRLSIHGPEGQNKVVTGRGLKQILESARSNEQPTWSKETTTALESLGKQVKDFKLSDVDNLISELKVDLNKGKISQQVYNEMVAPLIESRNAYTSDKSSPVSLFETYLVSRRVVELAERGISAGPDLQAAKTIANDPALAKRFGPALEEFRQYQRNLLDFQRDAGLITDKQYKNILSESKEYIPFDRVIADEATSATGSYRIKGSTRDIIAPMESMVRQTFHVVRAGERNQVRRLIGEQYGIKAPKETAGKGEKNVIGTMAKIDDVRLAKTNPKSSPGRGYEEITWMDKGVEQKAYVPKLIAEATKSLDPQISSGILSGLKESDTAMGKIIRGATKAYQFPAKALRAGSVLHPAFGGRNFTRDQINAGINSNVGTIPFIDSRKGFAAIINQKTGKQIFPNAGNAAMEWEQSGGNSANLVAGDRSKTQKVINDILYSTNTQNSYPLDFVSIEGIKKVINPVNWMKGGLKGLQELSEFSESATRITEYMNQREAGMSQFEAGFQSREITLDFARMGANMKALNSCRAFLNARIQGVDKFARMMVADTPATMGKVVNYVVTPAILSAMVRNDYIYNSPDSEVAQALMEVPNWMKQTYYIIPTEVGIFKIAKPQEFGVLFANPAESLVDYIYASSQDKHKNYLETLMDSGYGGSVADAFMLSPDAIIRNTVDSTMLPLMEGLSNYSFFTGASIIPPGQEKFLPPDRANRGTSETAKLLSRLFEQANIALDSTQSDMTSPPIIDHLIRGYTGSLGADLTKALDVIAQKTGIVDDVNKPAKTIEESPFFNAFMYKYPSANMKSIQDFYEENRQITQTMNSYEKLMSSPKAKDRERAAAIARVRPLGDLSKLQESMSAMDKAIRVVEADPTMSPEEKRKFIEASYIQKMKIARIGLRIIEDMKDQLKNQEKDIRDAY